MTVREMFEFGSEHAGHSGTCREDEFLRVFNKALTLIWPRGDWLDTIGYGRIKACSPGLVRMPWNVHQIRDAWTCKTGAHVAVRDQWFSPVAPLNFIQECGHGLMLTDTGRRFPVANDPVPASFKVRTICGNPPQPGDELGIHGFDHNGMPVREILAGECMSQSWFSGITNVVKGATSAPVSIWAVWLDNQTGLETQQFLSLYHPENRNPEFPEYRINGRDEEAVMIRFKKRLILPANLDHLSPITNPVAMAFAMQAINHLGRDNEKYGENVLLAEEQLSTGIKEEAAEGGGVIRIDMATAQTPLPGRLLHREWPGVTYHPGTHNL